MDQELTPFRSFRLSESPLQTIATTSVHPIRMQEVVVDSIIEEANAIEPSTNDPAI